MEGLRSTHIELPEEVVKYSGKVRDVYIKNNLFISVASDRISAFDHILPRTIPFKGQVLNQTAAYFLESVKDIIPVWMRHVPDPNVTVGVTCEPIRIEMVIRGYLTGHSWREYRSGKRVLCGEDMIEGLKENDPFPVPLITPSTKAVEGHDMDISKAEIISQGLVPLDLYEEMELISRKLFRRGQEMALAQGLILVDTKYEFGLHDGTLTLMDEIHTPDSSRYFYLKSYFENQLKGLPQNQLSKEFVREWLISKGFQGLEGQVMPEMDDEMAHTISERYILLYETITGNQFQRTDPNTIQNRVEGVVTELIRG
ncbi:MAG: phosphoribosylaminoimidazolesuccinocarboxamide synthase [Saprospiraceae bacterium]|nr:phosphoribosylaminoimidazolesuccinocarboxamide synthase [Candidatus Brachybacter algidus]MBK8602878.1 phosphoribosylaminoimidazolesuccinocarboxamide synthase [Candidatus Brachybacter algidus]